MLERPLVPSNYAIWFEPPDEKGDEVLRIVSERRSITLKGRSFRDFHRRVLPLLDGHRTVAEIHALTADLFERADLDAALALLEQQGVLVEADGIDAKTAAALMPQLNFFHESDQQAAALQGRLAAATVSLLGLGGGGATIAHGLALAGCGALTCIDPSPVTRSDCYLTGIFEEGDIGRPRAERLGESIAHAAPATRLRVDQAALACEEDVRQAVAGADLVICSLDAGQLNLALKLNRVCLAEGLPFLAYDLAGGEIAVGPLVTPGHGPCYLCYRMRSVACAGNPESAFAYERHLDARKADDSAGRANLNFGIGLAANLIGLEAVKILTGLGEPALAGRLITVDLLNLRVEKHAILRKPWCPACHERADG